MRNRKRTKNKSTPNVPRPSTSPVRAARLCANRRDHLQCSDIGSRAESRARANRRVSGMRLAGPAGWATELMISLTYRSLPLPFPAGFSKRGAGKFQVLFTGANPKTQEKKRESRRCRRRSEANHFRESGTQVRWTARASAVIGTSRRIPMINISCEARIGMKTTVQQNQ